MDPFISFYTPTYRRPQALARCIDSVQTQTAVASIEHLIVPDYIGRGVGGMFAQIPQYADAVHGQYVHVLADDDVLASPTVVERIHQFARDHQFPSIIIANVIKGGLQWPQGQVWPPVMGQIDLGCLITRADVWKKHCGDYGQIYEGDYLFAKAVSDAGYSAAVCDVLFLCGAVSRGAAEVAA